MALTYGTALRDAIVALTASSPTPRLDAEVLLRHITGSTSTGLIADADRPLGADEMHRLGELIARRERGEPIAYLTGEREFWSLRLKVTPATLIPRPETELLVEKALAHIPPQARWNIADLGTGSGAIALAIAHERPRCRVHACDDSAAALAVARANAETLGLDNVEFHLGNWLEPLGRRSPEVVVSNPPYVRADDPHLNEGDVRFEPRAALIGGPEGLDAIRVIAQQAFACLMPGGGARFPRRSSFGSGRQAAVSKPRGTGAHATVPEGLPDPETKDFGDGSRATQRVELWNGSFAPPSENASPRDGVAASLSGAGGWLLLEHGHDQAATVAGILTAAGFCEILCHHDLAGHDRVTVCRAAPTGC